MKSLGGESGGKGSCKDSAQGQGQGYQQKQGQGQGQGKWAIRWSQRDRADKGEKEKDRGIFGEEGEGEGRRGMFGGGRARGSKGAVHY